MQRHQSGLHRTLAIAGSIALLLLLAATAGAQTKTVIYHFAAGSYSNGGLIFDAAGNLYGTAQGGGSCGETSGCGIVYELSPTGGSTWTQTVLNTFSGTNGAYLQGGVIFDAAGNLYGVTSQGGANNAGVVFELSPTSGGWTEQVLWNFTGGSDGGAPVAGIVLDGAGNVYGTTSTGGTSNAGVLYQLTQSSSVWTENVILNFADNAATGPSALAIDAAGNLYGTATNGQSHGFDFGDVYELSAASGWTVTPIFSFYGTYERGTHPTNGVTLDAGGNLYGMTQGVVLTCCAGVVYELQSPSWTEDVLERFQYGIFGGIRNFPSGPVTVDALGNVYGAIGNDDEGANRTYDGFVFRIGPSGNAQYTFPTLLPENRYYPVGGLAIDSAGNVYGVTFPSSSNSAAAVFEITFPL
jgi:uncharacterized repeat protein (TIGR03803 family)